MQTSWLVEEGKRMGSLLSWEEAVTNVEPSHEDYLWMWYIWPAICLHGQEWSCGFPHEGGDRSTEGWHEWTTFLYLMVKFIHFLDACIAAVWMGQWISSSMKLNAKVAHANRCLPDWTTGSPVWYMDFAIWQNCWRRRWSLMLGVRMCCFYLCIFGCGGITSWKKLLQIYHALGLRGKPYWTLFS